MKHEEEPPAPLTLLAFAPAAALAAGAPKVAVLDVKAVGRFDPQTVAGLSALIASTAAGHREVKAITGSDLMALLGLERQKELLGCSDTSCLAQIAGGLAVEYLITSEVSEVGAAGCCPSPCWTWRRPRAHVAKPIEPGQTLTIAW